MVCVIIGRKEDSNMLDFAVCCHVTGDLILVDKLYTLCMHVIIHIFCQLIS